MELFSSRLTLPACALALTACLSYAPLEPDGDPVDLGEGSVGMLTVRLANELDPGDLPTLTDMYVADNEGYHTVKLASPHLETDDYEEYLISFQFPPGDYWVTGIVGQQFRFFFMLHYIYDVPVKAKARLPERSFVYLGHFDARISDGEVAVRVEDRYADDVELAKRLYGVPASADVLNQTPKPGKRKGSP